VIIQCDKCGTNYRFDEILIDGDGIWVRCTRCQNIFFLENPAEEKLIFLEEEGDEKTVAVETHGIKRDEMEITFEDQVRMIDDAEVREDRSRADNKEAVVSDEPLPEMPQFFEEAIQAEVPESVADNIRDELPEIGDSISEEVAEADTRKPSGKRTKFLASVFVILAVAFAVYLILFPQFRRDLADRILAVLPLEETVVVGDKGDKAVVHRGMEIYFIDTKEHAVNNWIIGDILVVAGIAVNKGDTPASKVKVRGKILDAAGSVLKEEMSYGGTILTAEELRNLTGDELRKELSNPWGRDFDNRNIAKDGKLPFMIVFINPPESSQEYVIDLASADVGTKK